MTYADHCKFGQVLRRQIDGSTLVSANLPARRLLVAEPASLQKLARGLS
uniref:IAA-amino acid hydrolase ILR1-like 5 n=1 Tax=Rhizophora mucronata TaxID=61149 RepID=A0A2P2P1Y7_RHIMU